MPMVGFLHSLSSSYRPALAFRQGLNESGYIEGQNVVVEYRWAEGQYDKLSALAMELVDRKVTVIFAGGGSEPATAAKLVTATIPIVFVSAADPVRVGIVASLNRPGGNVTGVSLIGSALEPKRLELLQQLVPQDAVIGVLVNPKYPDANVQLRELREAAEMLKRHARLRPFGPDDRVELLYWSSWKEKWAPTGPFGRTVLPLDQALRVTAKEAIFWTRARF